MDKRYEKKEQLIKNTFKELLSKKYFEQITVQELTNEAGIDRKTFYLHYKTLDALLRALQKELSDEFSEQVKGLDPIADLEELTKKFFYYSESKGRYYEKITLETEYSYIRNQMIKTVMLKSADAKEDKRKLTIAFIVNTTLLFYSEWVRNQKVIPIDEVIDLTVRIIKNGIAGM